MEHKIKKKIDTLVVGIIVGIIVPTIIYFLSYHQEVMAFIRLSQTVSGINAGLPMFMKVAKLCLISDAAVFFLFYWLKLDKAAKGVLVFAGISVAILLGYTLYPHLK